MTLTWLLVCAVSQPKGYVIIHSVQQDDIVAILHVVPGNRDIAALLGYS